jgi:hypothetical protein
MSLKNRLSRVEANQREQARDTEIIRRLQAGRLRAAGHAEPTPPAPVPPEWGKEPTTTLQRRIFDGCRQASKEPDHV